jgi:hypothetical protein
MTSVSGNNGTISCNQYCNMAGYSTCTSTNNSNYSCETVPGLIDNFICYCSNPGITTYFNNSNNGTMGCDQYCQLMTYSNATAAYSGSTPISIDSAPSSPIVCVCNKSVGCRY